MYTKAIEANNQNPSYFNNRGIAHKNLKEYEKALEDYT
jgi:hypothetical protein